jgi:molybdopterin-containing oxidoreductase family membrane subunit
MWTAALFSVIALVLLIVPAWRRRESTLIAGCIAVFISTWIDKGMALVVGGFIPNPFEKITEYWPTAPELGITFGVWATGLFILTVLFKIAVSVKEEVGA